MKKLLSSILFIAILFNCVGQRSDKDSIKKEFIIVGGILEDVAVNMGVTIDVDTLNLFPNGGYTVTVDYSKFKNRNQSLKHGKVIVRTISGSQIINGATKIKITSKASFEVIREIDGKLNAVYIFSPQKAIRKTFNENGKVAKTEQVLP